MLILLTEQNTMMNTEPSTTDVAMTAEQIGQCWNTEIWSKWTLTTFNQEIVFVRYKLLLSKAMSLNAAALTNLTVLNKLVILICIYWTENTKNFIS